MKKSLLRFANPSRDSEALRETSLWRRKNKVGRGEYLEVLYEERERKHGSPTRYKRSQALFSRQFILLNKDGGVLRADSLAYGDTKREVSRNWGFPLSHIRVASSRNKARWGFRR